VPESVRNQKANSAFRIVTQNQPVHLPLDGRTDKRSNVPQRDSIAENESKEELLLDALMTQFGEVDFTM